MVDKPWKRRLPLPNKVRNRDRRGCSCNEKKNKTMHSGRSAWRQKTTIEQQDAQGSANRTAGTGEGWQKSTKNDDDRHRRVAEHKRRCCGCAMPKKNRGQQELHGGCATPKKNRQHKKDDNNVMQRMWQLWHAGEDTGRRKKTMQGERTLLQEENNEMKMAKAE